MWRFPERTTVNWIEPGNDNGTLVRVRSNDLLFFVPSRVDGINGVGSGLSCRLVVDWGIYVLNQVRSNRRGGSDDQWGRLGSIHFVKIIFIVNISKY